MKYCNFNELDKRTLIVFGICHVGDIGENWAHQTLIDNLRRLNKEISFGKGLQLAQKWLRTFFLVCVFVLPMAI